MESETLLQEEKTTEHYGLFIGTAFYYDDRNINEADFIEFMQKRLGARFGVFKEAFDYAKGGKVKHMFRGLRGLRNAKGEFQEGNE